MLSRQFLWSLCMLQQDPCAGNSVRRRRNLQTDQIWELVWQADRAREVTAFARTTAAPRLNVNHHHEVPVTPPHHITRRGCSGP